MDIQQTASPVNYGRDFKPEDLLTQRPDALQKQVGGDHYKKMAIQPVEYIHRNNIPFIEGCIIKYVTRWRNKGGVADLDKAIHFLELLKKLEEHGKS